MTGRNVLRTIAAAACAAVLGLGAWASVDAGSESGWSLNATAIEACSCPMFCQCYFNSEPAGHGGHGGHGGHDHGDGGHFCRFNMAWKVNQGRHGDTRLDGAKFWIAGDLGSSWEDGKMDWAAVHFDPAVTAAQRQGILTALGGLFPVEWNNFGVQEDKPVEWSASEDSAVALLAGGEAGEIRLQRVPTALTGEPVVLTNLRYWGAPRNDGFIMMQNEVEAYRIGDKPFEFKGTNGFMITFDIASKDPAPKAGY
jgi:hypothetical protein